MGDTILRLPDAEYVGAGDVGSVVPPLGGWAWHADETEVAILGAVASCRWALECQNWCWQIGTMVFVVDVRTHRQVHAEFMRRADPTSWPYALGRDIPPPCPSDVHGGACLWLELPARGIAYAFWYSNNFIYDLEARLADLPVIREVVLVYDLATHEQLGAVDLVVPGTICGPHDSECP
ncbi:MAG: hypothetical protein HY905_10415 [Deltaproteobacteria bacterium]|nr:hypothetical protein [Deltaproteobacteria bacterium]